MPDEILVKFRVPVTDVPDQDSTPSVTNKSCLLQQLRNAHERYRMWEITPLLKDSGRRRSQVVASRDPRGPLRRRNRAARGGKDPAPERIYRIRLDLQGGRTAEEVLAAYRSRPDVEYAERNPVISICATPNDPLTGEQWSLSKIRGPDAWDTCRGDRDIIVAVIDTGVDYSHRDLQSNMWVNETELNGIAGVDDDGNGYIDDIHGYNFAYNDADPLDDHGHGTHCAGTIGAAGNNGLDIAGICWAVRIMPLKVLGAAGDGSVADAVPAIYYAIANDADVISISWGGEEDSDTLREAIAYAHREGVVVVAAAGNEGSDTPYFPAALAEVVSVTATESNDRRWYLANYGDWVDLAAPGRDILSLRAAGTSPGSARDAFTCKMSGTSMAAPHVSGACALLLAANPLLACDELHEMLTKTGDPIAPGICASNSRLNLLTALRAAIPAEGMIRLERTHYAAGAEIGILLADWDLRGAGQQTVLMETSDGDQEIVTLSETTISLGVFRGAIQNQAAVLRVGNGLLEVQDGGNIHARYENDNGDAGQADRWRQASAVADYDAPTLSDLRVERNGPTATIELVTSEPTVAEIRYGGVSGGPYELEAKSDGWSDRHTIALHGLKPQTPYWFAIRLADAAGNEVLVDNDGRGYSLAAGDVFAGFRVPGVYPTIQAAIDEAADGDTVWVADGTYSGPGNIEIDFRGKAITVRSENGPHACIIDCNAQGRAFYFHTGETAACILDGFTITDGGNVDYGGGIRCMGSSPTIRNCILLANSAAQYGGGLCNCYGSNPDVTGCTFESNSCSSSGVSERGGGMANRQDSSPAVSDCVFSGNSAAYSAGAMGNFDASSPRVVRCTFRGNSSRYSGGAVGNWDASRPTFRECTFNGNQAREDGGAMCNMTGSVPGLENCIFYDNHAEGQGGAVENYAATMTLANCTISGNRAEGSCGGIWNGVGGAVRLDNCILWANADGRHGQSQAGQVLVERGVLTIQYCDVQGWTGTLGGLGNFGRDPLFADPNGTDFHLRSQAGRWDAAGNRWVHDEATSPCIDAGNPGWPLRDEPAGVPKDSNALAANQRIDMGAYGGTAEASLPPPGWSLRADLNNDGVVDWRDLVEMSIGWLQEGEKHPTNLTRDSATGPADLALLAQEWRHRVRFPTE